MRCSRIVCVVFFVLTSQFSFGQIDYLNSSQVDANSKLRKYLLGEWFLCETKIVDGYGFVSDTNHFISDDGDTRKIVFRGDSVEAHPIANKRFYTGFLKKYQFEIEFDSLFSRNSIRLYEGRRRKRKELELYEVVKCDRNELILKSDQKLNSGLDLCSVSVFYTYQREGVDSLLSKLSGSWHHCSKEYRSFFSKSDTSMIKFTRSQDSIGSLKNDSHISIDFYRNWKKTWCVIGEDNGIVGTAVILDVQVDPKDRLLYFGKANVSVYNIESLTENELVVSFNRERTETLKKAPELILD